MALRAHLGSGTGRRALAKGRVSTLPTAFVAATLSLALVLASLQGALFATPALAASSTLSVLHGTVLVRHGSGPFLPAVDGQTVEPGDVIRTGGDGRALVRYFDGSTAEIEESTELIIEDLAATSGGDIIAVMVQTLGRTWHTVTRLLNPGSRYEVRTSVGIAVVRGTRFAVDYTGGEMRVVTAHGNVRVSAGGATVDVTAGLMTSVVSGGTPQQPVAAPPQLLVSSGGKVTINAIVTRSAPESATENQTSESTTAPATRSAQQSSTQPTEGVAQPSGSGASATSPGTNATQAPSPSGAASAPPAADAGAPSGATAAPSSAPPSVDAGAPGGATAAPSSSDAGRVEQTAGTPAAPAQQALPGDGAQKPDTVSAAPEPRSGPQDVGAEPPREQPSGSGAGEHRKGDATTHCGSSDGAREQHDAKAEPRGETKTSHQGKDAPAGEVEKPRGQTDDQKPTAAREKSAATHEKPNVAKEERPVGSQQGSAATEGRKGERKVEPVAAATPSTPAQSGSATAPMPTRQERPSNAETKAEADVPKFSAKDVPVSNGQKGSSAPADTTAAPKRDGANETPKTDVRDGATSATPTAPAESAAPATTDARAGTSTAVPRQVTTAPKSEERTPVLAPTPAATGSQEARQRSLTETAAPTAPADKPDAPSTSVANTAEPKGEQHAPASAPTSAATGSREASQPSATAPASSTQPSQLSSATSEAAKSESPQAASATTTPATSVPAAVDTSAGAPARAEKQPKTETSKPGK